MVVERRAYAVFERLSQIDTTWWMVAAVFCALLALLFLLLWSKQRSDLVRLRSAARAIIRRGPIPSKLRFRNRSAEELWRAMLAIGSRSRAADAQSTLDEVISIGSRITGAADGITSTAEEVADILLITPLLLLNLCSH